MSSLVDMFEFFENTHATTLSKYRGTAWRVGSTQKNDLPLQAPKDATIAYDITDKTTKRHLADTYSTDEGKTFSVVTTHMSADAIEALGDRTFSSSHEAAKFVWQNSVSATHKILWRIMTCVVTVGDLLVAFAKVALKVLVVVLAVLALFSLIFGVQEGGGLFERVSAAVLSLLE